MKKQTTMSLKQLQDYLVNHNLDLESHFESEKLSKEYGFEPRSVEAIIFEQLHKLIMEREANAEYYKRLQKEFTEYRKYTEDKIYILEETLEFKRVQLKKVEENINLLQRSFRDVMSSSLEEGTPLSCNRSKK